MARLRSTTNQGQRGLPAASTKGKTPGNPMKPKLAAKIKLKQGLGGGIKQAKGGANYVSKARGNNASGIKQAGTTAKKPKAGKVGQLKLNRSPIKAQPKYAKKNPIQPKANFTLRNSVTKGDVSRMRKAHNMGMPSAALSGKSSFGSMIGR